MRVRGRVETLHTSERKSRTWPGDWQLTANESSLASIGSGTAVRALVCDGDPGICDPLSCDYPRCADNPSIDDGEVHANSGSCLEYSSWGIKASRSRTSTVSHYIGNHNARDDLQKFCTYDSSCNVLCQIDIQDFILEETWGITSDGCHVFRGVVESRDGVNGGIASQGASCTGVAGAAVRPVSSASARSKLGSLALVFPPPMRYGLTPIILPIAVSIQPTVRPTPPRATRGRTQGWGLLGGYLWRISGGRRNRHPVLSITHLG